MTFSHDSSFSGYVLDYFVVETSNFLESPLIPWQLILTKK